MTTSGTDLANVRLDVSVPGVGSSRDEEELLVEEDNSKWPPGRARR